MTTLAFQSSHVRPRPARCPVSSRVRLTRRGRAVVLVAMLVALFVTVTVFGSSSAATDEAGTPTPTRTVEVRSGDTLWDIAAEVAAPGDVRETVHELEELNALPGPTLTVGQRLAVPVR